MYPGLSSHIFVVVAAGFAASCASSVPSEEVQPENYAVYDAIIEHFHSDYQTAVVLEQTEGYDSLEDLITATDRIGAGPETIQDFSDNVDKRMVLDEDLFRSGKRVIVMNDADYREVFGVPPYWENFFEVYPDSHGYVTFSAPGFGNGLTEALVYYMNIWDVVMAEGLVVYLEKQTGVWVVVKSEVIWIS